ncbi:hypothetical protein CCACVL1_06678, partial [Corchorus capsularis]
AAMNKSLDFVEVVEMKALKIP